jgi:transposase
MAILVLSSNPDRNIFKVLELHSMELLNLNFLDMNKKQMSLEVVNPNAGGIDVGSRSHWVAIGQDAEDIREFGVYSQDHQELCKWLSENGIESIAMESTGTYWQNLFSALTAAGFDVILVNGKQTKNVKGKKTDIKDCQWIQKLHCLGLLSHSFLPDSTTEIIRTYSRHRQNLIKQSSRTVLKVQKYLRLMNMRLDVVVNDVVGLTGTKIISAFIAGETVGKNLAKYRHYNCRKPEEEIAKALQYNGRADYLFALKQEWETYLHIQKQITEVDGQIKKLLEDIIDKDDNKKQHVANKKPYKRKNKNTIRGTDMNQISYKYFEGIDLIKKDKMKTTADLIMIAGTGASLVIDASKKPTVDIIQIVGSIGLKNSHITIKNASSKPTSDLIQIATVYPSNITFDFTETE